ncbi:SOS response-associated peptidase [Jeotgalibacillus sp. ET6]|uniref:SOS response-associated peptidase n=1 Tax=Jeotgalibacillus sp. ET6 TaxID=3037260 RepID=UPI002418A69D|nr:SOS response-associated peptidase [Jeotgalibacillus sp. ET6]MDG5473264.1 SOS response-associated peptidase [Jeotgalibacillus sp. ET6]
MCGRFSLIEALADLKAHYDFKMRGDFEYATGTNIAPSQYVTAVVEVDEVRYPVQFRWGLIPPFAKDEKVGYKTFNARSETAAEKPSFKRAFQKKRCLIPASSFYEWHKINSREKQPYAIKPSHDSLITFAGLWETWKSEEGSIRSCTILTTQPNEKMASIHDRMPVILEPDAYSKWLNPNTPEQELKDLLHPCKPEKIELEKISNDFFKTAK